MAETAGRVDPHPRLPGQVGLGGSRDAYGLRTVGGGGMVRPVVSDTVSESHNRLPSHDSLFTSPLPRPDLLAFLVQFFCVRERDLTRGLIGQVAFIGELRSACWCPLRALSRPIAVDLKVRNWFVAMSMEILLGGR